VATVITTKLKGRPEGMGLGPPDGPDGWGDGDGGRRFPRPLPAGTYSLGMWFGLASISMFFIGLTSSYVVRQGLDPTWRAIALPDLLLINTVVLLASSVSMELARRALRPGRMAGGENAAAVPDTGRLKLWLMVTLLLGLVFLGGQVEAWRQLSAKGIYLGTNPHGSFLYVLTALHGLHLLGGVLALSYVVLGVGRRAGFPMGADFDSPRRRDRWVEVTALYWHFMDGLWVYLFVLLFVWK
jgi:cytochrome c oxidase subunit III